MRDTKKCCRCGEHKAFSEFTRDRSRHDGLQHRCKTCHLAANREWAQGNRDVRRATLQRQNQKQKQQLGRRATKVASPEQNRAHQKVYAATKRGVLSRPVECSRCGSSGFPIQAHHADYSKPLDVIWLCSPCHGALHANERSAA